MQDGLAKTKSSPSKIRTAPGWRTGGRSTTSSSGKVSCSRALPPPVKKACSVCAASCTTRSPSIRPGHPRSSASSFGVNMQSFRWDLRLRVDDDVGDVGALRPDSLLDLARPRVGVGERALRVEPEGQE